MGANDKQIAGDHYKMPIEPWDAISAWDLGYFDGTAVKYLARWQKKNGVQDLEKAKHFIEKLIEVESGRSYDQLDTKVDEQLKLLDLYTLFLEMHEYTKNHHNHFLVAANIVKDVMEGNR